MRLFSLLASCLILLLPTSLFAYTTHRTTAGPLSMHFGTSDRLSKQETITQFDEPLELTATLENKGDTPLAVKVTFRTIETLEILDVNTGGLTPPALVELPTSGTANVTVKVAARQGTYTAHYPVRMDAEFPFDGETVTAHIIQVIETEFAAPPAERTAGGVAGNAANILPENGGLALSTLNTYRGVWNYDNQPQVVLPIGFQGDDRTSGAHITRLSMNRGGVSRQSLGMHPPWRSGIGNVGVEYRVKLPNTNPITLSFFSAIRDVRPPEPPSDGVTYRVKVDGKTVYEKHDAETDWVAHEVNLSDFAGQEIILTLESDPGPNRDTTCDACYWGDVILFAGTLAPTLSDEEKQKLFAENLLAVKTAKSESPKTRVYNLDGGLTAAVTFGNYGFIDGVIGLGNAEKQVQFDGLRVWVKGQLVGATPSALSWGSWEEAPSYFPNVALKWSQEIAVGDDNSRIFFDIKQKGPALQLKIYSGSDDLIDRIEFGPATHHAPRVYYGHGYCIVEPEAFTAYADGHNLSTSHVGMDFDNGLSVLQATSFPPDSFTVEPKTKRYTLSVHPGTTMTLLPGTKGAFDCAIRYRPLYEGKRSAGVATKAGRFVFDIWGGRYSEHLDIIKHAAKYGLTDSLFIAHNWQHYGYDDRLPDIFPPNPRLGTLKEMQEALELCNSLGMLYGVHDNYIDIYPDADGYNFDMTTFHENGQPRKAWNNYGIEAQSYQFRPDKFRPFLEQNLDLIVPNLPMSAYFVDVFSSLSPMDYYDRTGKFHSRAETRRQWNIAFDTIRNRLSEANKTFPSAVTVGESGGDWLIGHLDGADSNFMFISPEPGELRIDVKCKEWSRVPWYNAVHHTRFSLHGVGYSSRYEAQRGRAIHGIESDDYITAEILTGHALMVDHASSRRGAVRKYWLAQDLIRYLAGKEIIEVEFVGGNIHRQKITWDRDGDWAVVYVNLDEKNDWAVSDDRVAPDFVLSQYGYLGLFRNGYSAIHKQDGRVVESSHRVLSDRMNMVVTNYINVRQKTVDGLLPIAPAIESFRYLGENRFAASFKWTARESAPKDLSVFVHCVERRRAWHHRPNEAVLGGAFPAVPTSEWSGEHVTDYQMTIPDTLPAGRYHLVVGLYAPNDNGRRAKLIGFNTDGDRYAVGWINVERREGAVSNITFEPLDWDETELYERLLPPKEPVEFAGGIKTKGAFRIVIEAESMTVTPLPEELATEIALICPDKKPPKTVKALDDSGRELRDVPFTFDADEYYPLVFTTQAGEFAYKIVW